MAHYVPTTGFEQFTGALSKKKIQGVHHMTVTRRKKVKDPLTGEVVGLGPKEIYAQERRDYDEHPLTPKEAVQRSRWREACREASLIIRDKSHPRFMEMYELWRVQLAGDVPCKQFPNFVRQVRHHRTTIHSEVSSGQLKENHNYRTDNCDETLTYTTDYQ